MGLQAGGRLGVKKVADWDIVKQVADCDNVKQVAGWDGKQGGLGLGTPAEGAG